MRSRLRWVAAAGALALVTACGSTVQVQGAGTLTDQGQDLSPEGTTTAPGVTVTSGDGLTAGPGAGTAPSATTTSATTSPTGTISRPTTAGTATGIPGITRTTITVGVLAADPSANKALDQAGLGAASTGDEKANWEAAASEINAHGGIAGRQLKLVFHLVNLADPPAQQGQKGCARFTQDNKVAAVLAAYYYSSLHTCLSQKGIPALVGTNYGVDTRESKLSRTVVAWATPLLDRIAVTAPGAFLKMGKLKAGVNAGIFVTDAPAFRRSADLLSAALKKQGVIVTTQTVRDSDSGDYAGATNDASSAVLRFRSAGVTEVLFLSHNAFEPTLLMQVANSQSYRPTYLLTTQQYPGTLPGLAPAGQLVGSVALGWAPAVDTLTGYAASAAAKQCLAMMKRHGLTYDSSTKALVALLSCDGVNLLAGAAAVPGGLANRAALQRAALDATSFVSTVTFKTAFLNGRRDGVAAYRPMAFSQGCTCYRYTGATSTF